MRLGEILLRHGLITPDELGEGLATQVTHGGRIGSNLIDLGYIAVDDVARALGNQHSVPAARDEAFRAVTSATLGAVPRDLCAKHGIFPLALDGTVLHLAMRNPQYLALIDNLGRVLNLTIQPYATAELRLLYFLELLYAIPRPKRYLAATGAAISRAQIRQLVVPMNTDSLFAQAIADLRPTRGPADALQHMIATYLRAPTPGEACVTPICLHGKVINLLCTQSQTSLPEAVENDLAQIADQAAIAYKRLILQKRGDQAL